MRRCATAHPYYRLYLAVQGGAAARVWLLCLLASMCPGAMVSFWAAQLDAFCEDWGVTAESVGMPRV